MYTGIIQALGKVVAKRAQASGCELEIATGTWDLSDVALGDSLAINGVCLTVTRLTEASFFADISPETLAKTTLGQFTIGTPVNLEKCLRPIDRLGGHWVQGHVDGVGQVMAIKPVGNAYELVIACPADLARYIAYKGSICVDGVSLTVNAVTDYQFHLMIIPHTWKATVISTYEVGTKVNLEVDIVARYLERLVTNKD